MELLSFPDVSNLETLVPPLDMSTVIPLESNKEPISTKMDVRTGFVHQLFDEYQFGNLMLYKVVRGGATTSLVLASIDRGEKCLIIEPTNRIATDTIVEDVKKLRPNAKLVHVKANSHCILNEIMCEQYPDLRNLQFLPLAQDCDEKCEFYYWCPITEPIRVSNIDVLVITADKLSAIMLGRDNDRKDGTPSIAKQIFEVISKVRNVVFDEAHWMQNHTPVSLTTAIMNIDRNETKYLNLGERYSQIVSDGSIEDKYKSIRYIVNEFSALLGEQVIDKASSRILASIKAPDYHEKHISTILTNPRYSEYDIAKTREYMVALCAEAIELIKSDAHWRKYRLMMQDINNWFTMAEIEKNRNVQINAIRSYNNISVNITGSARIKLAMTVEFIRDMQMRLDKRIILTSATFGSYKYENLFIKGTKVNKVMFGKNGDPKNTNSKMLILADCKRYSNTKGKYSVNSNKELIAKQLTQIFDEINEEYFIIAANKQQADFLKKELEKLGYNNSIDYYGSDRTIGVKSNARVCIPINLAYAPSNTYDIISRNSEESKIILEESMNAVTWQAWNRVKDPEGIEPSVVIPIGVTADQCLNIATWGFDRQVTVGDYAKGKKKLINVTCSEYIPKPNIMQCGDFGSTILMAKKHLASNKPIAPTFQAEKFAIGNQQSKLSGSTELPTCNCNILIGSLVETEVSHDRLLNLIFSSGGMGAGDLSQLSESKIKRHIAGKETQKTSIVSKDGLVRWIQFKDIKLFGDLNRLCTRLKSANIPYMTEQNTKCQTYNVWIFIKPIDAKYAKKFGEKILKDIEKLDRVPIYCDFIPKYTKRNNEKFKLNNEIKLPLHQDSRIFVEEGFTDNFESLKIGIIDLDKFAKMMELRNEAIVAGFNGDRKAQIKFIEEYDLISQTHF